MLLLFRVMLSRYHIRVHFSRHYFQVMLFMVLCADNFHSLDQIHFDDSILKNRYALLVYRSVLQFEAFLKNFFLMESEENFAELIESSVILSGCFWSTSEILTTCKCSQREFSASYCRVTRCISSALPRLSYNA